MCKPEIIGYQTDHGRMWSCTPMPDITYDSDGISVPCISIGYDGKPYEDTRYLGDDEIDGFMRHHGMKRVYKPREFHAGAHGAGYLIHCKKCGTNFVTTKLPHDAAKLHAMLHPENTHHYSTSWADRVE